MADLMLEKLKRLRGMMQPIAQPQVAGPPPMSQQPYLQAEAMENEAAPRQVEPQGVQENLIAGIMGAMTPGGFGGMMQQRQQNERQRQQDLLARARAATQQGFQQQQLYRGDVNAQLDREQQAQLARLRQVAPEKFASSPLGIFNRETGQVTTPAAPQQPNQIPGRDVPFSPEVEAQRRRMAGGQPAQEPLMAIMGPDGKPVYVPRSQAVGRQPAAGREQGRAVTSGDANRIADFDTSLDDLTTLRTEIPEGATGTRAKLGAMLPNAITEATGWGETAKQKQAVIDRVKQVIGKALEGGVLRKEDEYKYVKILPTIGDTSAIVKTKIDGLERAIQERRQTLLESLSDAGYEVSRYQARGGQPTSSTGGPKPGTEEGGYVFQGGDPADAKNWKKK